jgi:hypothetical protein
LSFRLNSQQSGNQVNLSWPAAGVLLQAQTNGPGGGITSSNWFDVAGSTATNLMTITINPTNGSVFFRLSSP